MYFFPHFRTGPREYWWPSWGHIWWRVGSVHCIKISLTFNNGFYLVGRFSIQYITSRKDLLWSVGAYLVCLLFSISVIFCMFIWVRVGYLWQPWLPMATLVTYGNLGYLWQPWLPIYQHQYTYTNISHLVIPVFSEPLHRFRWSKHDY